MKLIDTISDEIYLNFIITFSKDINNAVITVEKDNVKKQSYLPLSDHFYEDRISAAIQFMIKQINEIQNPTTHP